MDPAAKCDGHQASWHFWGVHLRKVGVVGPEIKSLSLVCFCHFFVGFCGLLMIGSWEKTVARNTLLHGLLVAKDGPLKLCGPRAPLPAIVLLPPVPGEGCT